MEVAIRSLAKCNEHEQSTKPIRAWGKYMSPVPSGFLEQKNTAEKRGDTIIVHTGFG